jgi:hypothetical protein
VKKFKGKHLFQAICVSLLFLWGIALFSSCVLDNVTGGSSSRQAGNASHLIINQFYGANYSYNPQTRSEGSVTDTPISHSFVELYNPANQDIDLRGYSLQYADVRNNWIKLNLTGTIPARSSFLVRANPTNTIAPSSGLEVTNIIEYDQGWNINFNSKGSKIVLLNNTQIINKLIKNPFNTDGLGTKVNGYIDMLGVGGNDPGINDIIDGYEYSFHSEQSKQKAFRRIDFADTNNNEEDFMVADYRLSQIAQWARPRTSSSGPWNVYSHGPIPKQPNEVLMTETRPYTLHNMFGEDPKTTWNFTWQTLPIVPSGHAQILESVYGDDFSHPMVITVPAERTNIIGNDDPDYANVALFRVGVTGLKPGTAYYYRVGSADMGYASGSFKTETVVQGDFTFIHLSDSQATTLSGYRYFGRVVDAVAKTYPDLAFFLETGDLIDTVDREDEWRGFFENTVPFADYALVPVVGNHEQARGNEAASFRKHFTVPDNGAGGRVTPGTTYYFNYGNTCFIVLNTESYLPDQKIWLENVLQNNTQKWTIVSMHKGIYGQTGKSAFFDAWASTLDKYGVDLVLNGHDHVYVRTYPMRNDQRVQGGTVYLQSGGSGMKRGSSGAILPYQEVQSFHSVPSFSVITVTHDRIIIDTRLVDVNPEISVMSPFQWFQIIKTGNYFSLLPWRNLPLWRQEYRLAG